MFLSRCSSTFLHQTRIDRALHSHLRLICIVSGNSVWSSWLQITPAVIKFGCRECSHHSVASSAPSMHRPTAAAGDDTSPAHHIIQTMCTAPSLNTLMRHFGAANCKENLWYAYIRGHKYNESTSAAALQVSNGPQQQGHTRGCPQVSSASSVELHRAD